MRKKKRTEGCQNGRARLNFELFIRNEGTVRKEGIRTKSSQERKLKRNVYYSRDVNTLACILAHSCLTYNKCAYLSESGPQMSSGKYHTRKLITMY